MAKIPIKNYERYTVTDDGKVFVGDRQLKTYKDKRGYHAVYLYDGHNNRKYMAVHRLVMMAFSPIDNPSEMTVNHKNNDKNNNTLENLEWMTNLENIRHAFANGYRVNRGGRKGNSYAISQDLLEELYDIYKQTGVSIRQLAIHSGVNIKTLQYQFKKNFDRKAII